MTKGGRSCTDGGSDFALDADLLTDGDLADFVEHLGRFRREARVLVKRAGGVDVGAIGEESSTIEYRRDGPLVAGVSARGLGVVQPASDNRIFLIRVRLNDLERPGVRRVVSAV